MLDLVLFIYNVPQQVIDRVHI